MAIGSKNTETDIEIKNTEVTNDDIIDIEFKELQKKKFRLDRDNNRIIELNTSDLTIIKRLEDAYPRLMEFVTEAQSDISSQETDEDIANAALTQLPIIDGKMRELIDYIFDSKISDKAAPDGSMYDLFNGKFRFEYVIEKLLDLYDTNFTNEYDALRKNISKHTSKYTKKRK